MRRIPELFITKYDYCVSLFYKLTYRRARFIYNIVVAIISLPSSIYGFCKLKFGIGNNFKLVIGSQAKYQKGWIPTDKFILNITNEAHWKRYFSERQPWRILAEHIWEHLSPAGEAEKAAALCYRYLSPGGCLRAAVPDGFNPDREYIDFVRPGGTGPGAEDHKVIYNYNSLSKLFKDAGFKVVLLEYFDEHGEFYSEQMSDENGIVNRSVKNDPRNKEGKIRYTSLVMDCYKN